MSSLPRALRLLAEVRGVSLHAAEHTTGALRMASAKGAAEMWQRRCEARASLSLPALMSLVDHGEADGLSWVALRWVHGPTFEDWAQIAARDPAATSPAAVAWIIARAAEGLHALGQATDLLPAGPLFDILLDETGHPRLGYLGELSSAPRLEEKEQVLQLLRWLQRLCGRSRPAPIKRIEDQIRQGSPRLAALADALDDLARERKEFAVTSESAIALREQLSRRTPFVAAPSAGATPVPASRLSTPDTSSRVVVGGKYRLVRPLGGGSTGQVYLADSLLGGKQVALKIVQRTAFDGRAFSEFTERFRREAKAMAGLSHPGIVAVHDFGDDDVCWIAMEYVDGPSLAEHLAPDKRLTVDDALSVGRQLCAALGQAHGRGIIHRDIKPANILLSRTEPVEVKLADFGLAKNLDDANFTIEGELVGTPHYMSPEQCLGKPATVASDTYALGALLFRLLTGRALFEGLSGVAVLTAHTNTPPPTLAEVLPGSPFPEPLQDILSRALTKLPEERFHDTQELDAALAWCQVCLRPDRSTPRPAPRAPLPAREASKAPVLLAAAGAAGLLLLAALGLGAAGIWWSTRGSPPAPEIAKPAPSAAPIEPPVPTGITEPAARGEPPAPEAPKPEPKPAEPKPKPAEPKPKPAEPPKPAPAEPPSPSKTDLKNPFKR